MSKEKENQESGYRVEQVAITTEGRVYDGENVYTVEEALVLILNKIESMEKKIVG